MTPDMNFKVTLDPKFAEDAFAVLPQPKDMRLVAIDLMTTIRHDTQSGVDVDGNAFQEYAAMTRKKKILLGRNPDLVDLTDKNRMLGQSMQVAPIQGGAMIYFADAQRSDVAMRHNYGIGVPQRIFFAVSRRSFDQAIQRMMNRIKNRKG